MHKFPFVVVTAIAACLALQTFTLADNPVIQTKFTADPAPLVHDGVVYLYTSHDEDDAFGFKMKDWLCYTSTDMVNWTDHGRVASLRDFKWADPGVSGWGGFENGAWAPQCIERNGKFYMYCPVQGRGIGVLVADNPFGPFKDPIGKPLIGGQYDSIDPTVFVDDDGQAYLYWGNPNLWYIKLNPDMISFSGEITKDASIAKVAGQTDPYHYQEGPWAYKRNGHYYMAYASTCCPEGIGYAMSDKPTGPWTFKGYIMRPDRRSSGNHPGIIDYKGNSYVFGFNYKLNFALTTQHRERRSVCVEKFEYNPDGTIPELPWWNEKGVSQLGTLSAYERTEAETICWSEGIKSESTGQGGMFVYPTGDKSSIRIKGVNFGTEGAGTFMASLACETKPGATQGGNIELHLDSESGPLVGTLPVNYTNGNWKTQTVPVTGATGVHDLALVFRGETMGATVKADFWQFTKKTAKPKLVAISTTSGQYKLDSAPGANHQTPLKVLAIYSDGTSKDVTTKAKILAKTPGIASVSKGSLIGMTPGETSLIASFQGKSDVLSLVVKDLKTEVVPQKLTFDFTERKFIVGSSQAFSVQANFLDGHTEDVTNAATYSVSNPKIASLKTGLITALDEGATQIRAEFKGKQGPSVSALVELNVSYRNPFVENKADDFTAQKGLSTEAASGGGRNLCNIENGDWVRFSNIDFGAGAHTAVFSVASATQGGKIGIYLDNLDTRPIGTCEVENTGGWQTWVTKSCKTPGVTGRHDVYFKFVGNTGYLLNLRNWKFE